MNRFREVNQSMEFLSKIGYGNKGSVAMRLAEGGGYISCRWRLKYGGPGGRRHTEIAA